MAAGRQAPAVAENVDPVYEWLDDGDSYLLRLNLPEFKKEDFRVHVDGEGRLTVIGQHRPAPGAGAEAKAMRLHKAFQLPNTANLDAVSGRFDGTVLTLRVPKLQQEQQPAATPLPPPSTQAKEEAQVADGGGKPAAAQEEKAAAKVGREAVTEQRRIEAAERASLTARGKEEDDKAKPVAPPAPEEKVARGGDHRDDQDEKARAEHGEKVAREAARRIEAARARVAEAKAKAERERQCEHWKERAVEEGLKLADAVSKKKEVIAAAVAAFTLGVFVSHKLFSRS
ncbi:uncharacterized protein C2845_PM07G13870 [Panicum miliaceum]|uniref:SHSP domain-containing protein n=1 Tax=Panicum miliaceum TaxID=4540 RepID=A0A3L6SMZ1_PANMI|nr:uncharacterized protein C2845_PM07G13870 [Panicum miliaceum]